MEWMQAREPGQQSPLALRPVISQSGVRWVITQNEASAMARNPGAFSRSVQSALAVDRHNTLLDTLVPCPDFQHLPRREDSLQMADMYMRTVNCVLPIFRLDEILALVHRLYEGQHTSSIAAWTAVNAVFALATAYTCGKSVENTLIAQRYFQRAADALVGLMLCPANLVATQALLAMSLYVYIRRDHESAGLLVAAALRSYHALAIPHAGRLPPNGEGTEVPARRVFWVAFILDQSIALVTGAAPTQDYCDIVLDLPAPRNKAPLVPTSHEELQHLHFRLMCELALIRGKVFRHLYSEGALRLSASDVHMAIKLLNTELLLWKQGNTFVTPGSQSDGLSLFHLTHRLSYCNTLILINCRYLYGEVQGRAAAERRERITELCAHAAWDTIELVSRMSWWHFDYTGVLVDYILFATRTICSFVVHDQDRSRREEMLEKVHEQVTAACGPAGTGHDVHSHLTLLLVKLAQLKGYDLGPGTRYGICKATGGGMSS